MRKPYRQTGQLVRDRKLAGGSRSLSIAERDLCQSSLSNALAPRWYPSDDDGRQRGVDKARAIMLTRDCQAAFTTVVEFHSSCKYPLRCGMGVGPVV